MYILCKAAATTRAKSPINTFPSEKSCATERTQDGLAGIGGFEAQDFCNVQLLWCGFVEAFNVRFLFRHHSRDLDISYNIGYSVWGGLFRWTTRVFNIIILLLFSLLLMGYIFLKKCLFIYIV